MNCPFCGREMEVGFLQGGRFLLWAVRRHKISLLPREEDVLLAENHWNFVTVKDAYLCRNCKKVLFDYAATEVQDRGF